jgi:hypothetical protein
VVGLSGSNAQDSCSHSSLVCSGCPFQDAKQPRSPPLFCWWGACVKWQERSSRAASTSPQIIAQPLLVVRHLG